MIKNLGTTFCTGRCRLVDAEADWLKELTRFLIGRHQRQNLTLAAVRNFEKYPSGGVILPVAPVRFSDLKYRARSDQASADKLKRLKFSLD